MAVGVLREQARRRQRHGDADLDGRKGDDWQCRIRRPGVDSLHRLAGLVD